MFQGLIDPYFIVRVIVIVLSLVIHELAHALTADALGDKTARMEGRITLNPLAHLEPIGLIMILFAPIGWARPVSVNSRYFKHPRRDLILVAAAGPLSNLLLACIFLFIERIMPGVQDVNFVYPLLLYGGFINVALFIFNLIPLPPLDGSRIVSNLLPYRYEAQYRRLEVYGPFILLLAVLLVQGIFFSPLFNWAYHFVASWFGL